MKTAYHNCYFLLLFLLAGQGANGQIVISGTVYDSTKLYPVSNVTVMNTAGYTSLTDSTGSYRIEVAESDSISFFYRDKHTVKFPVSKIDDYTAFDISLRVRVNEKYKLLKGVTVYSDTYKIDSLENRVTYAKVFGRSGPTIRSNYEEGGAAGLDVNELIGMFQFKKNRSNLAFQNRLLREEEDRFVDYRFSSQTITRITGLKDEHLSEYKKLYRPSYESVAASSLAQFYEYILKTSYIYKRENGIK